MPDIDCRSLLYMPASSEKLLAKGPSSSADAIIIDLEDAVAPSMKARAREQAVQALQQFDYGHRIRALRINGSDTIWHTEDLYAAARARPDALVLPKVESAAQLLAMARAMSAQGLPESVQIWAMMESPRAVLEAASIAACRVDCPRLSMMIVGVNDLVREACMPMNNDRSLLLPWLMQLVAAARASGLLIVDGVYNDFSDAAGLEAECLQGVAMGMDGKSLIHPVQIATANRLFAPSSASIDEAQAIVAAFADPDNIEAGVLQVNGRMVERLHLGMAERLLARAKRIAARS